MHYLLFITIFLIIVAIATISYYNKMVSKKNYMQEAWSSIDVFLKKRYDLIPSLVEVVKGYAGHEKGLLENLTQLRASAMKANNPQDKIDSENKFGNALANIMVVSENYPDLKANTNFLQLQQSFCELETDIESARRYYNGTVRDNNTFIESFPGNIFAGMFNFPKGVFFQITETEKSAPTLSF